MDFLKRVFLQDMDDYDPRDNPYTTPWGPPINKERIEKAKKVGKRQAEILIDDIERTFDMYDDSMGLASRLSLDSSRWEE